METNLVTMGVINFKDFHKIKFLLLLRTKEGKGRVLLQTITLYSSFETAFTGLDEWWRFHLYLSFLLIYLPPCPPSLNSIADLFNLGLGLFAMHFSNILSTDSAS
mmetsp:Transcript_44838/g.67483  ORF Transcript_44838/g.67483 Transcript_44838/m.67483 type:complete len:105 (+) Transcript_44838:991-1305(+)